MDQHIVYNAIENIPPAVLNVGNPTANEVITAMNFSILLESRRTAGLDVDDHRIVDADVETLKVKYIFAYLHFLTL